MKRLSVAASFIEKCGTFADIGCDHGYVSLYALENSFADKVWACDISAPSLNKARKLLKDFPAAEFFVSDGFGALPHKPDTAVISGMGGHEIIKIISGERCADTLILQPQNHAYELRKTLYSLGFIADKDVCVSDRGRYYDIIRAKRLQEGETKEIPIEEKLYWGAFCDEKNSALKERLECEEKKLAGYKQTENNAEKLRIVREVLKWQR